MTTTIKWTKSKPAPIQGGTIRRVALPGALTVRAPAVVVLLQRDQAAEADTICECGGLLAYIAGRFQHLNMCLSCYTLTEPCGGPHVGCFGGDPQPAICQHRGCLQPVTLTDNCAMDGDRRVCCGCCLDRGD